MMNEMKKMKTLTLQGIPFEVVDEAARNDIESVKDTLENLPKNEIVIPDLAQNDPTAPDYVKNRTHWVEIGLEVQTEESVVNGDDLEWSYKPTVGEVFDIIFDGTVYENVVATQNPVKGSDIGAILNVDTEQCDFSAYPFALYNKGTNFRVTFYSNDDVAHDIKVCKKVEQVHTLDPKFLHQPPKYEINEDWDSSGNSVYTCELAFDDAFALSQEDLKKSITYCGETPLIAIITKTKNLGECIVLRFVVLSLNSDMTITENVHNLIWSNSGFTYVR